MRWLSLIILLGLANLTGANACADAPITIIIPLDVGGAHERTARIISAALDRHLGEPAVLRFIPGDDGAKGTAVAASAPPDGRTLLFTHNFIDQLHQHVAALPYDPNAAFVAIAQINDAAPSMVASATSAIRSFDDLIAMAKARPNAIRFGDNGIWGTYAIAGGMIFQEYRVRLTSTSYDGGGPAIAALLRGEIDVTMAYQSTLRGHGDALRVLATPRRASRTQAAKASATDLSLVSDAFKFVVMQRIMLTPRKTPLSRIAALRTAFAEMQRDESYRSAMIKIGENLSYRDGSAYETTRIQQSAHYAAFVAFHATH